MYILRVEDSFSSAHFLRNYRGKCENIHGHNWRIRVSVRSRKLVNGMVIDFTDLKKHLKDILGELDHKLLNQEVVFFKKNNPTSEHIASYLFVELKKRLTSKKSIIVHSVEVWETDRCSALYTAGAHE